MGLEKRRKLISIMAAVNIIFLFGTIMYVFFGPAFYVVGGDSMEHKTSPQIGFIDFKDGVIVRTFGDDEDVITYYEGKRQGYMTFGDYGDVISFDMKDLSYPISHRAICFVKFNLTGPNATVDIPELDIYGARNVTFDNVGFRNDSFYIDFLGLYQGLQRKGNVEMEGYLTKGDNEDCADQAGMELVANHSVLGKVTVVDNELVVRSSYEYIFLVFVLIVIVVSYFSDLMFREKGINRRLLLVSQNVSVWVLFNFIFYKDLFLIFSTEKFSSLEEINYVFYAAVLASVPVILGTVALKTLKGEKEKTYRQIPMIIIGAFIPYFFIMTFVAHMFFYSLVAYSFAVSLIFLSPTQYFQNSYAINEKEMGGWIFLFSFEIFVMIMMINMALPFYSVLIIGMIFVNYLLISLWKNL